MWLAAWGIYLNVLPGMGWPERFLSQVLSHKLHPTWLAVPKLDPRVSRVLADGKKWVLPMEATAVFLQEREHRCSSISLLSVSDYLFWQQFREKGRTEAGIQLLSISLGSKGTDCLNPKNVQRGIFFWISSYKKSKSMH